MNTRPRFAIMTFLVFVIAASSALAGNETKRFTVTSSLDGKKVLPLRIHWIAHPRHIDLAKVFEVDYFIDGKKAWDEHNPPYYYGGYSGQLPSDAASVHDGNSLVTAFLKPGLHVFTVRALASTGHTATDTVKARVIPAPPPPAKFAGPWTRVVTPDDAKKGPPGIPTGRWTITVSSVGWATAPGDNFDVRYLADGNVVMGPEVVTPKKQAGGFCGVDPPHTWTVALSADDNSMQLDPLGTDDCGDRVAVMQGTWTRAH